MPCVFDCLDRERILIMRKYTVITMIMVLMAAWGAYAQAALIFNADFARNGNYENSWPLVPGQVIAVDIYVSNVPEPGLVSMGFKMTYDPARLEVVTAGTEVDGVTWFHGTFLKTDTPGEIEMSGSILLEPDEDEGLSGDNIRLGTVTFRCLSEGTSAIMMLAREEGYWFVLFTEDLENVTVLDGDIGEGITLATIRPPVRGDVNGDELVDLVDALMSLKIVAGINQNDYIHTTADVSGVDVIDLMEVIYILQYVSGLR